MTNQEIIEEMNKYTETLEQQKNEFLYGNWAENVSDEEFADKLIDELDKAKQKIHKTAMECLDKILTSELKVFVRNLCFNQLGYPDEPIFYKMFGEYPQIGDKVSEEELKERGINIEQIKNQYLNYWGLNGNDVVETEIDGKKYFQINRLEEDSFEQITDETKKQLRTETIFKELANGLKENGMLTKKLSKLIDEINGKNIPKLNLESD